MEGALLFLAAAVVCDEYDYQSRNLFPEQAVRRFRSLLDDDGSVGTRFKDNFRMTQDIFWSFVNFLEARGLSKC